MKLSVGLNIVLALVAATFIGLYIHALETPGTPGSDAAFWKKIQAWKKSYDRRADSAFREKLNKFHDSASSRLVGDPFSDIRFAIQYTKYMIDSDGAQLGRCQDHRSQQAFTHSLWVDTGMIGKWADYIAKNNGDGIRIYFAKYTPYVADQNDTTHHDPLREDPKIDAGLLDNRYTAIFTITHLSQGFHEDMITKVTDPATQRITYEGVYDYSNLCPPLNCPQTPMEQQKP